MELRLYDTYTRSIREFEPLKPDEVGLYTCGPTVYNYAHIGNLRTYLFEDVLRRVLEFNGYRVKHVMNITDVGHLVSDADTGEDRMELGAQRTGMTAWEIAEMYTQAFREDMARLNIQEPTIWCQATAHIQEQIALVQCIEAHGFTYRTADGIYFDTSKLPDYGHLGRLDIAGLQAGSRVELGEKRNITDFALWKFSP
ncbi:MAG: class I tRNA ligase family protein, partial [Chloroflexi bacterium]|nr:class I tRNA ligase family protein [Chloroflexota bacterium]